VSPVVVAQLVFVRPLSRTMTETFASPSTLREFALETALQLRAAGRTEASEVIEAAATCVTSSGWEWLGGPGAAAASIRGRFQVSGLVAARLARIREAATSQQPYG
jgi:hypothetical protein